MRSTGQLVHVALEHPVLQELGKRYPLDMRNTTIMASLMGLWVPVLDAAVWKVGPGRTYTSPSKVASLVADGDTVEIDAGVYAGEASVWSRHRLLLRGSGGFASLVAPATIPNQKAIWVLAGDAIAVDSIEFSQAKVPDRNGAGIRAEGTDLTVRRSWFHDNENGILGGKGHVRVEDSRFERNGYGDGLSHNLYISNCDTFTLARSWSRLARVGHEVKSRAKVNVIEGNWIGNESEGTASYEIDLPNGGHALVSGNVIQQGAKTENSAMVSYGAEGLTNPGKTLVLAHNTLVNDRSAGTFVRLASGATGVVRNNLFAGSGSWISGVVDSSGNRAASVTEFVDRAGFDYRLAPGAVAIDAGRDPGTALGWTLLPTIQPVRGSGAVARPVANVPDVGAWEVAAGAGVHRVRREGSPTATRSLGEDLRRLPGTFGVDGRLRGESGGAPAGVSVAP